MMGLDSRTRRMFDGLLDEVMGELPGQLHELMEEVPLIVEDEPSEVVLREMGVEPDDELFGLHWGVPLPDRASGAAADLPDRMMIFRGPVLRLAEYLAEESGARPVDELVRQIRITVLHEIGHHFGMDEDDLARLGYE